MANPAGLRAAIMDDAIGMAYATPGVDGFMPTIDPHTNFPGKAKAGDNAPARARIAHGVSPIPLKSVPEYTNLIAVHESGRGRASTKRALQRGSRRRSRSIHE